MSEIEFAAVTKRYGDGFEALKPLDLKVHDGEFLVLVGPSGCGKTTALRLVAGLEDITTGRLLIGGQEVNDLPPKDRDLAMVFQSYALYPHMTVSQNIGFSLRLAGISRAEIERRVRQIAAVLDLDAHLERRPAHLSGGQRQRVAMGRAIVREPRAFLMDEPLSNLDAKLRVQMRLELARLQQQLGTTTVYVTHDQTEAMTLGHRVAVMNAGVLQQVGPPSELYERPANLFVAGFVGSPAMNFISGELVGELVRTPLGELPVAPSVRRGAESAQVVVGVRPEDLVDAELALGTPERAVVFKAAVEMTEVIGPDVYAHVALTGDQRGRGLPAASDRTGLPASDRHALPRLVARLQPSSAACPGKPLCLSVDPARIHIFAQEDGRSLTASGGSASATAQSLSFAL